MGHAPRWSVLTTVCDPEPDVLRACLDSVRQQSVRDLEHVVVDDASTDPRVRAVLIESAERDDRLRLIRRRVRGGIVDAGNDALSAASGELVALLDHDDLLEPRALAVMDRAFTAECDVAYSDHDHIRADGRHAFPVFKPDFSPERLRHQNYITHLVAARRAVVIDVGGFRTGFDGSQDHDLLLRLSERARAIVHVPEVLYHWRMAAGSVALDPTSKEYAYENGRRAVADHCARIGVPASVELGVHLGTYRVRRERSSRPTLSVLISSRGRSGTVWGRRRAHLTALLDSLDAAGGAVDEIVVASPTDLAIADERVTRHVVHGPDESPFSCAARVARGEVAIVLDEAMVLADADGIDELASVLTDIGVATVGSAQFHPDGCVRHGGFATHGEPCEILFGWHRDHPGPGRVMAVAREVAGVDLIGSAWRVPDLLDALAATDELDAATLGLQASQRATTNGSRVLWTPFSCWFRFDCALGANGYIAPPPPRSLTGTTRDPFYNVNLVGGRGDWLERPGCAGASPYTLDEHGERHWS